MTDADQQRIAAVARGRSLWQRIKRGAGYLPHCGDHPGTPFIVGLILMGAAAGAKNGVPGALLGGSMMALVFVPMWCSGCISRSDLDDRLTSKDQTDAN